MSEKTGIQWCATYHADGAVTPGPWRWRAHLRAHEVWLQAIHGMRLTILRPERWGFKGATLRFNNGHDWMERPKFIVPQPHHPWQASGIDHADARFIEYSREDVRDLLAHVDALTDLGKALADALAWQEHGMVHERPFAAEEWEQAKAETVASLPARRAVAGSEVMA